MTAAGTDRPDPDRADLAPVLDQLDRLEAAGPGLVEAISDLREFVSRQLLVSSRSISTGLDGRATEESRERAAVAGRLDELTRTLQRVEQDVGDEISHLGGELTDLRSELAKLFDSPEPDGRPDPLEDQAPTADLVAVVDQLEALRAVMADGPIAGRLARLEELVNPALVVEEIRHAREAGDPAPVLAELRLLAEKVVAVQMLTERVAELARPAPVLERLDELRHELPEVDLQPVMERLDSLAVRLSGIDLGPVVARIEAVRSELPEVDLGPLVRRVEELAEVADPVAVLAAVSALRSELPELDLRPVLDRLEALRAELTEVDLEPVVARIAGLSSHVEQLPVGRDLRAVEEAMDRLRARSESYSAEVLARIDELRTATDPSPLATELAIIRAALGDRSLTESLAELRAGLDPAPVLAQLAGLASTRDVQSVAKRIDSLQANVDPAHVLGRLDAIGARLELLQRASERTAVTLAHLDQRMTAVGRSNEHVVATNRQVLEGLSQLYARVEAIAIRLQTDVHDLGAAGRADRKAGETHRQELTTQLADISDRIAALRRWMAARSEP